MLKLVDVKKDYVVADTKVQALKDVSIEFRENEFVSILGPSGCGKTTLLNIIGGLDKYTSGDVVIDGVSTKLYKDRDWDNYRSKRIGFVFQSYNLIPHQTILENVELALTISGVKKAERTKRAKETLDKVGLKDMYFKKPNQLSGGQCQRVAIARALVNKPEILLADEPTGALDTVTSKQIMDLIKEISKECLVIMVTHNPELAEEYSTRIVRLLDGSVQEDTNPMTPEEIKFFEEKEQKQILALQKEEESKSESSTKKKKAKRKAERKSKLSYFQAFKLSARNLLSKFKRTLLVCIAGSIGIIGVASVLALSNGVTNYITDMQNDMLSGNPITISEEGYNLSSMMDMMNSATQKDALNNAQSKDGYINVDKVIDYLVERSGSMQNFKVNNDITEDYVKFIEAMPEEYYNAIGKYYGLDIKNNVYTSINLNTFGEKDMSLNAIVQMYTSMLMKTEYKDFATLISSYTDTFMQSINNTNFILSQYDIVSNKETSKIATEKDELIIVLNNNGNLSDLMLAQLGFYTQDEFLNAMYKAMDDTNYDPNLEVNQISYDALLGKTFMWYPNNTVFTATGNTETPFAYTPYADPAWENGIELKVTAILKPKGDLKYGSLDAGVYYTEALTQYAIEQNKTSDIVNYLNAIDDQTAFTSGIINKNPTGIMYMYAYYMENNLIQEPGFVGSISNESMLAGIMGGGTGNITYLLTLRDLGGCELPSKISIYSTDFDFKDDVTQYLDKWNSDATLTVDGKEISASARTDIIYTDNLSIIVEMINNMISMVTTALVAFTALSLVVSTVMIAIITYVSVIERIKEIGVIRSLGGRKKDVAHLFTAESVMIGGISGLIGIVITYILEIILNIIVGNLTGIPTIAALPFLTAVIMVVLSILLTTISGLIPASIASKKDPVVALRTE